MGIGNRIEEIRDGLTREEFGARIGVSSTAVQNYVTKDQVPNGNVLIRIKDAFNVNIHWLLTGEGSKHMPDMKGEGSFMVAVPNTKYGTAGPGKDLDAEMSFQKLALMVGVKIESNWVFNLADILGLEPWDISMSIHNDRISSDMLQAIENKGYKSSDWMILSETPELVEPQESSRTHPDTEQLLKMASRVLTSKTTYATSLAMNIMAFNKAINQEKKLERKSPDKEERKTIKVEEP